MKARFRHSFRHHLIHRLGVRHRSILVYRPDLLFYSVRYRQRIRGSSDEQGSFGKELRLGNRYIESGISLLRRPIIARVTHQPHDLDPNALATLVFPPTDPPSERATFEIALSH